MIKLITATPGSGKTLFAVQMIFKYLNEPKDPKVGLRHVYSNIDGLNIVGVLPMPEDWRDTPNGSVIFIDEAQMLPQYKKKDSKVLENDLRVKYEEIKEKLQIHRHTAHDIIFITQFPRLIHSDVIDLVGEHYHLHRAFGLPAATIYFWRFAQANPNTRAAKNDTEVKSTWKFPKHLYRYYQSATAHTHKTNIPLKYIFYLMIPFLLSYGVYRSYQHSSLFNSHAKTAENTPQTTASNPLASTTKPTVNNSQVPVTPKYDPYQRVAMVISSDDTCVAKNEVGEVLNIPKFKCIMYAENPAMMTMPRPTSAITPDDTPQPTLKPIPPLQPASFTPDSQPDSTSRQQQQPSTAL